MFVGKMAGFHQSILLFLFLVVCRETFCLPTPDEDTSGFTRRSFRGFIPKTVNMRIRRQGEGQGGGQGIGDLLGTAIQDGISASSAVDSPTMFIGGFSVMMQPMPNGTEFAGQLMQMAPHYMSLIPGLGGGKEGR